MSAQRDIPILLKIDEIDPQGRFIRIINSSDVLVIHGFFLILDVFFFIIGQNNI